MPRGKLVSSRKPTKEEENNYVVRYKVQSPMWIGLMNIDDNSDDLSIKIGDQYECIMAFEASVNEVYEGPNIADHPNVLINVSIDIKSGK